MRKLGTQLWERRPTVLACPDLISLPFGFFVSLSTVYFTISFRVLRMVGKMFSEFIFSWSIAMYWGRNSLLWRYQAFLKVHLRAFPGFLGGAICCRILRCHQIMQQELHTSPGKHILIWAKSLPLFPGQKSPPTTAYVLLVYRTWLWWRREVGLGGNGLACADLGHRKSYVKADSSALWLQDGIVPC